MKYGILTIWWLVVAMMIIACGVDAGPIVEVPSEKPSIPCGGSGGGGQVAVNQDFYQHLDLPGMSFSASGNNSSDRLSAYASGWIEQGVNGKYYLYDDSSMGIHFYEDDPGQFSLHWSGSFRIVSE